jgi:hypothetical protein
MEAELAEAQEIKTHFERISKELEKLKIVHKELERTQFNQVGSLLPSPILHPPTPIH